MIAGQGGGNGAARSLRGIPLPSLAALSGAADGDVIASDGAGGFVIEPQDPGTPTLAEVLAVDPDTGGEPITFNGGLSVLGKKHVTVDNTFKTIFTVALVNGTGVTSIFGGLMEYVAVGKEAGDAGAQVEAGQVTMAAEYSTTLGQTVSNHDTAQRMTSGTLNVSWQFDTTADGNFELQVRLDSNLSPTPSGYISWTLWTDTPSVVTVAP
jgi:hypothetical protein